MQFLASAILQSNKGEKTHRNPRWKLIRTGLYLCYCSPKRAGERWWSRKMLQVMAEDAQNLTKDKITDSRS